MIVKIVDTHAYSAAVELTFEELAGQEWIGKISSSGQKSMLVQSYGFYQFQTVLGGYAADRSRVEVLSKVVNDPKQVIHVFNTVHELYQWMGE